MQVCCVADVYDQKSCPAVENQVIAYLCLTCALIMAELFSVCVEANWSE